MEVKFKEQEVTLPNGKKEKLSSVKVNRLVDIVERKTVAVFIGKFGRLVLFSDKTYPAKGLRSLTDTQLEAAIKSAVGVK